MLCLLPNYSVSWSQSPFCIGILYLKNWVFYIFKTKQRAALSPSLVNPTFISTREGTREELSSFLQNLEIRILGS